MFPAVLYYIPYSMLLQLRSVSAVSRQSSLERLSTRVIIFIVTKSSPSTFARAGKLIRLRVLRALISSRCETCGYLCTLPLGLMKVSCLLLLAEFSLGHPQQEHETRHGSMSRTRWAIDGPDGTSLELEGRKFSSNDDGAPMLCNLVCTSMGRHVHIDYCRGDPCDNPETQHINERMVPNPDEPKDWITHGLHWRRMGKLII